MVGKKQQTITNNNNQIESIQIQNALNIQLQQKAHQKTIDRLTDEASTKEEEKEGERKERERHKHRGYAKQKKRGGC